MKTAVIYKSSYGATATYAKWIAADLGADLLQANQVKPADFQQYQTIIYGGGLYAGGVNGISLLIKNASLLQDKSLYIFTVGASDMTDQNNISAIRKNLQEKLPPILWERNSSHLYHLRGGMQYSKMSFLHRTMMKMFINMMRKKPENELGVQEKGMLDTYGKDVDFTDRTTIKPLVTAVKSEHP